MKLTASVWGSDMTTPSPIILATRELYYSDKGGRNRKKLIIKLHAPTLVLKGTHDCESYDGLFSCFVEFSGIISGHYFYGYDAFQAIGSASNIEPVLRGLLTHYDLFFGATGPLYFKDQKKINHTVSLDNISPSVCLD